MLRRNTLTKSGELGCLAASLAFCIVQAAQAQIDQPVWVSQIASADNLYASHVAVAPDDSVYATGRFRGAVDMDPSTAIFNLISAGGRDVFISKLAADGTFGWAIRLGDTGDEWDGGIAIDEAGNPHVTGSFEGVVDFDPGSDVFELEAAGLSFNSLFITKYDSNGNLIWARNFAGMDDFSGFEDDPAEIDLDSSGNVYIVGDFLGIVDFDPGPGTLDMPNAGIGHFVVKLSVEGDLLWAVQFNGGFFPASTEKRHAIAIDSAGNVHVAGAFAGSVDFDPGISFNVFQSGGNGTDDIYVCKLDTDGNFVWARQFTGQSQSQAMSLAVDLEGSVYTTGVFGGDFNFDPGAGTALLTAVAGSATIPGSAFVSKLSEVGDFVWATQIFGTSIGAAVTTDTSGDVFIAGGFEETADFDPLARALPLTSAGGIDMFIMLQAAVDGAVLAVQHVSAAGNIYARDLITDNENNFLMVGEFDDIFDFKQSASTFALSSAGGLDVFVGRLGSAAVIPNDETDGEEEDDDDGDDRGNHGIFGSGVCFIATAAYGTPLAEDIHVLRALRDRQLLTNTFGLAFVDTYYRISPPIADRIADSALLRAFVRALLAPIVVLNSLALASPWTIIALIIISSASMAMLVQPNRRSKLERTNTAPSRSRTPRGGGSS